MEFNFFPCRKTQDSSSHEVFGLLQLCPASLVSEGPLSMSTCKAPRCARAASLGSLPPFPTAQGCPQPLHSSAGAGVGSGPLPAMRPLLLWRLFFCCGSFAMRTSVLLSQLKVCKLSLCGCCPLLCHQEQFGSITFPSVLPKAVDAVTSHPLHPSTSAAST